MESARADCSSASCAAASSSHCPPRSTAAPPSFVKRLSAGEGFPEDFSNAHSLGATADGSTVFVESFSTNYLIQLEAEGDTVVRVFGSAEGLDTPHGIYVQP